MNVATAPELRRLDRAAVQPHLAQLSEWLLPGAFYGVQHTWPQLYRRDGDGRFAGLFQDDQLVSHCAWRTETVRTARGPLPVALLGSVATAPAERGRGHASRLLAAAIADCRAQGVAAILLWAEHQQLYSRMGFVPGSPETCATLALAGPAPTPAAGEHVRLGTVTDHARLFELHAQKPLGVVRCARTMSTLLTTPGMWTAVLERDGTVVAYACVGKGADLQNWWHEFGGSDADVAILLPLAMQLVELRASIALLPPYRAQLLDWLLPHTLETAVIDGPMVLALDGAAPPFWIDGLDSV